MSSPQRRIELKEFLRARRAALAPEDLGLPRGPRRLTPGLRREEVAAAAGVGVTWYTWLEQGRDIRPSPTTLQQLARALRLSPADESHLFSLAGVPHEQTHPQPVTIPPALMSVLASYRAPAVIVSSRFDALAFNPIAKWLFGERLDASPAFAALWNIQRIDPQASRTVRMTHPELGSIEAHSLSLPLPILEDGLLLLLAPANKATAASFAKIAERRL